MGMYTSITGWVRYYNYSGPNQAALRGAIERGVQRALTDPPKRTRAQGREEVAEMARDFADAWHFLEEYGVHSRGHGGHLLLWHGTMRWGNEPIFRLQVDEIAAALGPSPDGECCFFMDGRFYVEFEPEDVEPVEWLVYGGEVHERPLSRPRAEGFFE